MLFTLWPIYRKSAILALVHPLTQSPSFLKFSFKFPSFQVLNPCLCYHMVVKEQTSWLFELLITPLVFSFSFGFVFVFCF